MGSKWDRASEIVNDVRAAYHRNSQLFRRYNLEHAYKDVNALVAAVKEKRIPEKIGSSMMFFWGDWAALSFWSQYKQVYTMHPGLTRELRATGIDDKVHGSALRQLPHPDPLFVLPEGVAVTLNDGKPGRLVAFHVSGAIIGGLGSGVYVSTADPRADGLYLTAIAEVHNATGGIEDWEYSHTSIPVGDTFTIGELINKNRHHYSYDGRTYTEGFTGEKDLAYSQQVVGIALSHLLYAVSRNADMQSPRKTTTTTSHLTKRLGGAPSRPVKHQPVGYVIGAALDAQRRAQEHDAATDKKAGARTVRPHLRRAHWHTVRYGPGKSQSYVEWFPPIPVKMEGSAKEPTLHGY